MTHIKVFSLRSVPLRADRLLSAAMIRLKA